MTGLTHLRSFIARSPRFSIKKVQNNTKTVLPKLSNSGNLLAGATARIAVGLVLNPFSVVKARLEVCLIHLDISYFMAAITNLGRAGYTRTRA